MITLTPTAAQQAIKSAEESKMQGLPLRFAASRNADHSLHYAMGFDDQKSLDDHHFTSEGVQVVVAENSIELVKDMVVDYVEIEPGEFRFIFLNPNDPNFVPPKDGDDKHDSSGR